MSHARLSPSAAERWLSCPASVSFAEGFEDEDSIYATEGTQAHELAEMRASFAFGQIDSETFDARYSEWAFRVPVEHHDEMWRHTGVYIETIRDRMADLHHPQLLLERWVDTGIEDCTGTADAILLADDQIRVIDFKYGKGVRVEPEQNPQMMLYGLGALHDYGDLIETTGWVEMTVCQPRLSHVSSWLISAEGLREWRDTVVRPKAEESQSPDAAFGPGEVACRWCPASGSCGAQRDFVVNRDFGDPNLMDASDYAEALEMGPMIRDWCDAVSAAAMKRIYNSRESIPGWKVVASRGRRRITDTTEAIQTLIDAGYPAEQVAEISTKPLGALEKVVGGKEALSEVLGDLIEKTTGKPALVPESDARPALDRAAEAKREFAESESE